MGIACPTVKGAPEVTACVTVTLYPQWFTAQTFCAGMPQPSVVGPKSTVPGERKKQLSSPRPVRATVIDGAPGFET